MAEEKDIVKEPDEDAVEEVDDLKMSRTEEPEITFKLKDIRDKFVFDTNGNKIRFGDIYKKQKTIIFFVRHFMDYITKDYVEDIASIPIEYLQAVDARIVVIGPAPYKFINAFKKETGLQYSLYCDPERELYSALQLSTEYKPTDTSKSKHVKQGSFLGFLQSTWKVMRTQEWQGDIKQQGGTFIFGPDEEIHYFHIDEHQADHAPLNEVLNKVGVQQVSFPKDPRVQDL